MLILLWACATSDSADTGGSDTGDVVDTADSADTGDTGDTAEPEGPVFEDEGLRLGVPSFVAPGTAEWSEFLAGAAQTGGFVVISPADGVGGVPLDAFVTGTADAQAQGVLVVGYVHTEGGARDASDVDLDVLRYRDWYGVDGILFDEVPTDCATWASWYAERTATAETHLGPQALVIYKPDEATCQDYLRDADILVVAEQAWPRVRTWTAPEWLGAYAPERFWFMSYATRADELGNALSFVRDSGVAWVYVTDQDQPEPWTRPPMYWEDEIGAVAAD